MNTLSYYDRTKESWLNEEVTQLINEYTNDLLDIAQCANIHRRTPGSIAFKLSGLKVVPHTCLARGFTEYVTSPLYNEIVTKPKKERVPKKEKVPKPSPPQKVPTKELIISDEIESMKSDIAELKSDVKEILRLMHAIYEFQESESP